MEEVNFRGYTRLPTRKLCLAVRRSPCGEGTNTYDRWIMKIFKRVLRVECPID